MNRIVMIEHPGGVFYERLQELGMSVKEFSVRAGKPEKTVFDVIKGRSSVSPEMACLIERVTGMPAEALLKWQAMYDVQRVKSNNRFCPKDMAKWISRFPIKDMVGNRWLPSETGRENLSEEMLSFFGVASPEAWENYYFKQKLHVAFSISIRKTIDPYALSAWLRRGEQQADEIAVDEVYSPGRLKDKLDDILFLLNNPPDDVLTILREMLLGVGVKLFYTEPLPAVPVNGATRWIGGYPCIQILDKVESYDNFKRFIFHEIGHILLHGRKEIFIENAGEITDDPEYLQKEAEADAFAEQFLKR